MPRKHIRFRPTVTFAFAVLSACTMVPSASPPGSVDLVARAEAAAADGDLRRAAALYQQLAGASRGAQRAGYLTTAARLLIADGDFPVAQGLLVDARQNALPDQITTIDVLTARTDAATGQAPRALATLDALGPVSDPALAAIAAEARGLALFALGRPAEAIGVLIEREIWLDTAEDVLANQRVIWDGVARTPPGNPTSDDELVAGWLALAPLTAVVDDPAAFRRALFDWRSVYSTHPAANGVIAEIVERHRGGTDFPQRIALLLPLGSARRAQAQAVRDGFLAARIADGGAATATVVVFDTAERGAAAAYLDAQLDGADFIVGPLLPGNVDEIALQAGLTPTLALNFSQSDTAAFPPGFWQYALSPDDEAAEIAARAIAEGQRKAVALFASNDRGYRLEASFREAFQALGGEVVAAAAYVPEMQNASVPITEVLNISRSEQRHRRLQANLNRPVEFEARRREDVDMIFLQAGASAGRLLAPQLRFFRAGDLPTYATSDIYDTARGSSDNDLNGIVFPDLPILLTPTPTAARLAANLREFWPQQSQSQIRLYSFGYDAYQLIRPLFRLDPVDWPVQGVTGSLTLAAEGRVHRSLPFARFDDGVPTALGPTELIPGPPVESLSPDARPPDSLPVDSLPVESQAPAGLIGAR